VTNAHLDKQSWPRRIEAYEQRQEAYQGQGKGQDQETKGQIHDALGDVIRFLVGKYLRSMNNR
jgi:hypothetical protein